MIVIVHTQRDVGIALFAGSLAGSMASISAGGHVQPPPPSPPGHDPRTSSIQALRMRAKEHVESITKGLQMVWRLTEDSSGARTATGLVTAWRASEQQPFQPRHSRSRREESPEQRERYVDRRERESSFRHRERSPTKRSWTWREVQEISREKAYRSVWKGPCSWYR